MKTNMQGTCYWAKIVLLSVILFTGIHYPGSNAEVIKRGKIDPAKVFGRIQYVTKFADVKVKVVESFGDVRVQLVSSFADSAGKWEIVDSMADFKVEIVDSFEDFTIQYVDAFPGVRE